MRKVERRMTARGRCAPRHAAWWVSARQRRCAWLRRHARGLSKGTAGGVREQRRRRRRCGQADRGSRAVAAAAAMAPSLGRALLGLLVGVMLDRQLCRCTSPRSRNSRWWRRWRWGRNANAGTAVAAVAAAAVAVSVVAAAAVVVVAVVVIVVAAVLLLLLLLLLMLLLGRGCDLGLLQWHLVLTGVDVRRSNCSSCSCCRCSCRCCC
mmetsp:Transcript_51820/g.110087  ORF Transcript_51820/g.110087 Transcript_51820/m.110087 type:complete len:208 (+) Transcript_51820:628-1251(+)